MFILNNAETLLLKKESQEFLKEHLTRLIINKKKTFLGVVLRSKDFHVHSQNNFSASLSLFHDEYKDPQILIKRLALSFISYLFYEKFLKRKFKFADQ